MLSPAIYLMMNALFFTLRLSGGTGSFPRPLKPAEEREYLERSAAGDLEARNILVEHNLRLVAHIVNNGSSKRKTDSALAGRTGGDANSARKAAAFHALFWTVFINGQESCVLPCKCSRFVV